MGLTQRERQVLELSRSGLTDYRIAKRLHTLVVSITRSRENGLRKLKGAREDLEWAKSVGFEVIETSCKDKEVSK